MTYPELQINLDLLDKEDRLSFIKKNLPYFETTNDKTFIVCKNGNCYLFDRNGNECNINEVKEICEFDNYEKLNCINIPNSVTSIGNNTFFYCTNLASVTIPNSVTSIGRYVFGSCRELTSVTIPNSVMSIGKYAFSGCSKLSSMVIPDKVMAIGKMAFSGCTNLTSVTIPDSVIDIGYEVFYSCDRLKELIFKRKTIEEVKSMDNYPWEIKDESIIKCLKS